MTLRKLIDFVHCESTRPQSEYEDYEILIGGHPGEIGMIFEKEHIEIDDDDKKIIIWC